MKSIPPGLRRHAWVIPVVLIAVPLILWINGRGKPERLGEQFPFPVEPRYALQEDLSAHKLLLVTLNRFIGDTGQTIAAIDLPPGLHLSSRQQFHFVSQEVRSGAIYFVLDTTLPPRPGSGVGGFSTGGFVPPTKPIIHHTIYRPTKIETHLCRLSLKGNETKIETILTGKTIGNIAITDETAFWIDERPEPNTSVEDATGYHDTVTPTSLLMATSLKTHQTRLVVERMPMSTQFIADHSALYLNITVNEPGHEPQNHLWRYAPDLQHPVLLTANYMQQAGIPVSQLSSVSADRLYWEETQTTPSPAPRSGNQRSGFGPFGGSTPQIDKMLIVSAKTDGTDRQIVLDLPIRNSPYLRLTNLQEYQGHLYACLDEQDKDPAKNGVWTYLCRIDPDAPHPLVKLLRLPATGVFNRFQDGYAYFTVTEERDRLFGDLQATTTFVYFRWKLPR